MHELVLASQSPRRRQLLEEAGVNFIADPIKVSEIIDENLTLEAAILALSRTKALAGLESRNQLKSKDYFVLAADTVVVRGDEVLGKPTSDRSAVEMLASLSSRMHSVKTAFSLYSSRRGELWSELVTTQVGFRELTLLEIEAYVATGSPRDKAGAYGIQDPMAQQFVSHVVGSVSNVIGLPIERVLKVLKWWQLA